MTQIGEIRSLMLLIFMIIFPETIRDRKTLSQEFRLVSDIANLNPQNKTKWVIGISYFNVKERNIKNDDGAYGDPSDLRPLL